MLNKLTTNVYFAISHDISYVWTLLLTSGRFIIKTVQQCSELVFMRVYKIDYHFCVCPESSFKKSI